MDDLTASLARTLLAARRAHGWSAEALADRSGVSRTMISKIERGAAQPTAVLLGRLSGALGISLSQLLATAEHEQGAGRRLVRAAEQPRWSDPATGYQRRAITPRPGGAVELVEVALPGGARVDYPADTFVFAQHHLWMLDGVLHFLENVGPDEQAHELAVGDCLELGAPTDCAYLNPTTLACRYLVVLTRRTG